MTFPYSGSGSENYQEWTELVTTYLTQWCVQTYLISAEGADWSDLKKFNATCVYRYLTQCCQGEARKLITKTAIDKKPNKAWKALQDHYQSQSVVSLQLLFIQWSNLTQKREENGTKFIERVEDMAEVFE